MSATAPAAPIVAPVLAAGMYPIMEHFYTLQGEGAWTGSAAYFIRLAGCDVGCHWCDVKESWDASLHPVLPAAHLADVAAASGAPRAVITGGEPLLHDLTVLTSELHAHGLRVHIETSGTQPLSGALDFITFSPKKFKAPLDEYYAACHELKVIVHNRHDLAWAETHAAKLHEAGNTGCILWLQPEWSRPESAQWIVEYVLQHPEWRLSLQTHKYLNIP